MTTPSKRCSEILKLARSHQLPGNDADVAQPKFRQRVDAFLRDYASWAQTRDAEVSDYLAQTPRQYRIFLPHRKYTPKVAAELSWYFDEIVVPDPISNCLLDIPLMTVSAKGFAVTSNRAKSTPSDEKIASYVNDYLRKFLLLEEPLRDGIVLMSSMALGRELISAGKDAVVDRVLSDSTLRDRMGQEYDLSSRFEINRGLVEYEENKYAYKYMAITYRKVRGPDGREIIECDHDIRVPPGATMTMGLPGEEHFYSLMAQRMPRSFTGAIDAMLRRDVLEFISLGAWATAAYGTVVSTSAAERDALTAILSGEEGESLRERTKRAVWSHQVALPHLHSVDPQILYKMRSQLPDSFEVFRSTMASYCRDSQTLEQARTKSEEIIKVEKELAASLIGSDRSNRVIGYGALATAFGTGLLNVDWMANAPGLTAAVASAAGTAGALAAAARTVVKRVEAKANPSFFLWKTRDR